MLTKQCPRCHKIIPYGAHYCDGCQTIADEQAEQTKAKRNRYYDNRRRDKQSTQFYNSNAWKLMSHTVLQRDEYKCQECGEMATEVHHVIAIRNDWSKRFDITNCISLCTSCHNSKRDG